jgi:hypothetical protein
MALTHLQTLTQNTHNKTENNDICKYHTCLKHFCRTTSLSWAARCGGGGDEQVDMAYTWLISPTTRHSRARSTVPNTMAAFCYSLVGTLVARCYKGVVTNYYYYCY